MDTSAPVIGGVAWELQFFLHAFCLGFCLRMSYDLLLILRLILRHRRFAVSLEDFAFWISGSVFMFGLMYRENNGTPRLFAIVGLLAGMALYHLGPSRIVLLFAGKIRAKIRRSRKIFVKYVAERLKKRKNRVRMKKKE